MIGMGRIMEGVMANARGETLTETLGEVGATLMLNATRLHEHYGLALEFHERQVGQGSLRSAYVRLRVPSARGEPSSPIFWLSSLSFIGTFSVVVPAASRLRRKRPVEGSEVRFSSQSILWI